MFHVKQITEGRKMTSDETPSVDFGTPERAKHRGGISLNARLQTDAGIVTHQGAAVRIECVLDGLKETGLLDGDQGSRADRSAVGRTRYEQGLYLRELFLKAGLNPVKAMDPNALGGTPGAISDQMARSRMRFNQIIRGLGVYAPTVTAFVCHDEVTKGDMHLNNLRRGLDRLALMRE